MVDTTGAQHLEEDNIRSYLTWKLLGASKRITELPKKKKRSTAYFQEAENWWILKILILLNHSKIVVIKIGIGISTRTKSHSDNNPFNIKQLLLHK